ncbi:MAG: MFS transporter [Candidatus Edwardsbacteria bacterium]
MKNNCQKEAITGKKILGFPQNVFYLGLVSLLNDASSEMIHPLLPIFLRQVLGIGTAFLGLIEGIAESTASILKLFSGWLSDRLNLRKAIVGFGYALAAVCRPLIALTQAGWQVLAIRFFDRVGKGLRTSPRDALLADCSLENERGKCFSFHRSMDNAGAIVGPLLASFLLAFVTRDYRIIFLLAAIPGILSLLAIFFGVREKRPRSDFEKPTVRPQPSGVAPSRFIGKDKSLTGEPAPIFQGPLGKEYANPVRKRLSNGTNPIRISLAQFSKRFKIFLILITLFTLGNSSDAFLILRAKGLGIPLTLIPILWIVFQTVKMLSAVPAGILSDKIGRRKIIVSGWFIYFLVYLGFAFANCAEHIWFLFVLYGFFYGLTEGVERAFVADLVPEQIRGTAYGFYNFAIGIAALPASLIMGTLWQFLGLKVAFSFGAWLALLASLGLVVLI